MQSSHLQLDVVPGDPQTVGAIVLLLDACAKLRHQRFAQLYLEDEAQHHHYELQQKGERHTAEILVRAHRTSVKTRLGKGTAAVLVRIPNIPARNTEGQRELNLMRYAGHGVSFRRAV